MNLTWVAGVLVVALIIIVAFALLLSLAVHNPGNHEKVERPKYRMLYDDEDETPTWKEQG